MKLSQLSVEDRTSLAKKVGVSAGYLWQLSARWRGRKPSLDFMAKLVKAEPRLTLADLAEEFSKAPKKSKADAKPRKAKPVAQCGQSPEAKKAFSSDDDADFSQSLDPSCKG